MNTTTDEDLRAVRSRLVVRGAQLRDRIDRVNQDLRRATNPLPADSADAAIVLENDEILKAIDETARRELIQVERALARVETGTFARCEVCGEAIETARMVAIPYASRCRHCARDE